MKNQCKNIVKMFDTEVSVKQRKEIYNQILSQGYEDWYIDNIQW